MSKLTLVLPPLHLSQGETDKFVERLDKDKNSLSVIRKALLRGTRTPHDDQLVMLCRLFGLEIQKYSDIPVAALRAKGHGLFVDSGSWLCAEPVHLYPDLDQVILFDSSQFDNGYGDIEKLVGEMSQLLAEEGMDACFGPNSTLYFKLKNTPPTIFTPLSVVKNRNILPYLPSGEDSSRWRNLMNEMQMIMTNSEINKGRMLAEKLEINGLWMWGKGELPASLSTDITHVITSEPLIKGLAACANVSGSLSVSSYQRLPNGMNTLIYISSLKDIHGLNAADRYMDRLLDIEASWYIPALEALKSKELDSLTLILGNESIEMTGRDELKFWNRKAPASTLLEAL